MNHLRMLTAILLAAAPLLAQTPSQPPAPVFRSGLELVRLDVRVTDDEGRPIVDLRPDELRIDEDGAARPVLLFQRVEAPRGTYAEAAQRTVAAQVSTNQGSPHGHVYVFVFDEMHILPGHVERARIAAERFLRTHVRLGDRVALYALPGPGPQIDFTADVHKIVQALPGVRGAGEQTGTGALTPLAPMRTYEAYEIVRGNQKILDRLTTQVLQSLQASDTRTTSRPNSGRSATTDDAADNRSVLVEDARSLVVRADGESRRFLVALADIVRGLRTVDGRKAVILFSEGFQIDNLTHELEEVAAAAAQSYSVVYAMDLNPRTVDANADTPRGGEESTETLDKLQSLGSLTAETSGTLVSDASAQIDRALARVAETSQDYYLVGFTPGADTENDRSRYRRIHVSVTRPGAHVSARTGYALTPKGTPADRRRAIDAALRAPFAQEALKIEYTTYVLRGATPGIQRVFVSLSADLPIAAADAKAADVVYLVRDAATGRNISSGSDLIPLPAAPQAAGATTGTGLYRVQFEAPAGTYLMRVVVREPGGLIGTADRRFEVRSLNGPDVAASDLVLGSADVSGLPVRVTAYSSDVLTGVFELYGRTDVQLQTVTAKAELVSPEGGATAVSAAADLQPPRPLNGGSGRGARIALPLANVAPGNYLVRTTVRQGGETVAELLRDVTVREGERPVAPAAAPAALDPRDVLRGDLTRRLVAAIETRARGGPLGAAASAAAAGRWTEAEAALPPSSSRQADADVLRGLAAFARMDYASAIAALGRARESGANDAALAFVLGWAHAAAGDDRAAITAWRSAIVAEGSLVPPYLALVDAYTRLGERALALQVVKSGLRILPGSPELLDRLAQLGGGV